MEGRDCVFPFSFRGRSYSSCTAAESVNGAAWCATQVDSAGAVVTNTWQDCELECPRDAETGDSDVKVNITSPVKIKRFEFLEDPGQGCTWSYHNGERKRTCEPEPPSWTPEYHDRDRLECACAQERDSSEGHCKSEYLGLVLRGGGGGLLGPHKVVFPCRHSLVLRSLLSRTEKSWGGVLVVV